MSLAKQDVVTLATNRNFPHGSLFLNGKPFLAGGGGGTAWLIRFNNWLTDLNDQSLVTFGNDLVERLAYSTQTGKIYALVFSATRIFVFEIDPVTLTATQVISDTNFFGEAGSIDCIGGSIYVLTNTTPSKIVQYSLTDFSLTASATLVGLDEGHALRATPDGAWLIATGNVAVPSRGWVAKINPSTLAFTSQLFDADQQTPTDDFAIFGEYAWVGMEAGAPGIGTVSRVKISDLSLTRINTGVAASIFCVAETPSSIFVLYSGAPGKIVQIDPATLAISVQTLDAGETQPNELLSDGGAKVFVSTFTVPAKVFRFVEVKNVLDPNPTTATIANGQTESPVLDLGALGSRVNLVLGIGAPATLPETVNIEVASVLGGNFCRYQSLPTTAPGVDITLAADKAITIQDFPWRYIKLVATLAVAADRVFQITANSKS